MRITIVKAVAAGTVASIALAGIAFAPPAMAVSTATQPAPASGLTRPAKQVATLTEPIKERADTSPSGGAK
jgi:hypothetical protein